MGPVRFGSFCKRFVHGSFLYGSKTSVRIDLQAYCVRQKSRSLCHFMGMDNYLMDRHFGELTSPLKT